MVAKWSSHRRRRGVLSKVVPYLRLQRQVFLHSITDAERRFNKSDFCRKRGFYEEIFNEIAGCNDVFCFGFFVCSM